MILPVDLLKNSLVMEIRICCYLFVFGIYGFTVLELGFTVYVERKG
jgi:hypothetical protein